MVTSDRSPEIYAYLKKYQDDPSSRVFAPLAEAYRKAGMIDEAIEIASEGLRVHPHFIGGRVALARALFEKKDYERVIHELEPVVKDAPDNIAAQRLVAESSLMIGRVAQALDSYKMVLYFSPNDSETTRLVQELEKQAYAKGKIVLQQDVSGSPSEPDPLGFEIKSAESAIDEDPDRIKGQWMAKIERLQEFLLRVQKASNRDLS